MCKKCEPTCHSKAKAKPESMGFASKATLCVVCLLAVGAAMGAKGGNAAAADKSGAVSFGPLSSKYDDVFAKAGKKEGVSPILLASVAKAETGFNPRTNPKSGARGLMQLMPSTAKQLHIDPDDPDQAVDGAARYLAQLKKQFGSDELAIAAYNAGPGNVQKAGNHVPKIVETQNYVAKVEANVRSAS